MAIPSSTPTVSPVIQFSTAGDGYHYTFYCQGVRWNLTTAATSTWAIAICNSTAVMTATTYAYPLIGSSTQAVYLGGSTAAVSAGIGGMLYFPINNFVYGITVPTLTGGTVQVLKGFPPAGAHSYYAT